MPTQQGDLSLLNDPIAQQLLNQNIPGHLAYVWTDGSPRVIPIGFTWTGTELVTGTPRYRPQDDGPERWRQGSRDLSTLTRLPSACCISAALSGSVCMMASYPNGQWPPNAVWEKKVRMASLRWHDGMFKAGVNKMIRLAVQPTWVGILDFEKRFPSSVEKGLEAMMGK